MAATTRRRTPAAKPAGVVPAPAPERDAVLAYLRSLSRVDLRLLLGEVVEESAVEDLAPAYDVVGTDLVCHTYGGLRLSLVIPLATHQRFLDINADATQWPDQIAAWKSEVMPREVAEAIEREGERDFAADYQLAKWWARGLDVRLGKALS